uniref:Uncharacterized protein n=1 Tax=Cannabis sativa TaxID=3483 RepID=A0A803QZZ5_CANSA
MADAFFVPFFSSLNFNTHGHNMNTDRVDRRLQVFPWLNLIELMNLIHEQSLPNSNIFVRSILGIEISAVVICRNSYTHLQY